MTNDYSNEADLVGDAMDAVYENKKINKKNDVSGDFSSDTASYPTVKAMKAEDAKKVDIAQGHANYFVITNNSGNITTAQKIGNIDVSGAIGASAGMLVVTDNSGVLNTSDTIITIGEKSTANSGAIKTYQLKINGAAVTGSVDIDIPNVADMFLRSASLEVVGSTPTADETTAGLVANDKYLKLVVNTSSSESGATILRVKLTDFVDIYSADESTLTMSNNNVISIKTGGVDTNQLANLGVTTGKLAAKAVTKAKLADEVSAQWISDANTEIGLFASALAERINPSSP